MQDCLDVAPVRPEQHTLPQLVCVGWAGMHVVYADGEGVRVLLAQLAVRGLWHVTPPPGAWLRRGRARPPSLNAGERWTRCSRHSGAQREQGRYHHMGIGNVWMDVMIIQRHAAINRWRQTRVSARTQRRMDEEREKVPSERALCNTSGQSVTMWVAPCCSVCSERVRCTRPFATSRTVRLLPTHSPQPAHGRSREGVRHERGGPGDYRYRRARD